MVHRLLSAIALSCEYQQSRSEKSNGDQKGLQGLGGIAEKIRSARSIAFYTPSCREWYQKKQADPSYQYLALSGVFWSWDHLYNTWPAGPNRIHISQQGKNTLAHKLAGLIERPLH